MRVLIICEYSGKVRDAFMRRGHYARSCDLLPTQSLHRVRFADECEVCPCCGEEPWCPEHEMHYADCTCVGPTEDEAEYDAASFDTAAPLGARHRTGDAFGINFEQEMFDLVIAHPPCTYLANSGNKHLYIGMKKENGPNPERWAQMRAGAEFFKRILELPVPRIAVENPIMSSHAKAIIGREQSQTIQPYQFGHPETKATCLWLKNLPPLVETNNVKEEMLKLPKNVAQRVHMLPPSADRWKLRSTTYEGIAEAMADQWGNLDRLPLQQDRAA